jgi:hypothetical protein
MMAAGAISRDTPSTPITAPTGTMRFACLFRATGIELKFCMYHNLPRDQITKKDAPEDAIHRTVYH